MFPVIGTPAPLLRATCGKGIVCEAGRLGMILCMKSILGKKEEESVHTRVWSKLQRRWRNGILLNEILWVIFFSCGVRESCVGAFLRSRS